MMDKEDKAKLEAEAEATKARTENEATLFFWVRGGCQWKRLDR